MSNLIQTVYVEALKTRRSRMPLLTGLGFSMIPLVGGFFMIILKDPELARRMGLISAKAQIFAGAADWQTYLNFLAQATAIGGIILFSLISTWVFGREFSDRTQKDLLALPTPRASFVLAKFFVVLIWSAILTGLIYIIGLIVGNAVGLPAPPAGVMQQGTIDLMITTCMTIALVTPIAFVACAGRGYLAPMGAAILFLALAQIIAIAGWGEYFPWSIPGLYAGFVGEQAAELGLVSYLIVILTSFIGIVGTLLWWQLADQIQ